VHNNQVTLDLNQLVSQVKSHLSASGLTIVDKIPTGSIHGTVTVFQSDKLGQIQGLYNALQTVGVWMAIIAAALLVAGVLLAARRRRAIAWAAFGVLVMVLIATLLFYLGCNYYLTHLPPQIQSRAAAAAAFDILTRFLRQSARTLAVAAVVVWVVAFVSVPARGAGTVRHAVTTGAGGLGDRAERAGLLPVPVRLFVVRFHRWLPIADVVLIVVILLLWSHRTGAEVIWMSLLGPFPLLVIELLGVRSAAESRPSREDRLGSASPTARTSRGGTSSRAGSSGSTTSACSTAARPCRRVATSTGPTGRPGWRSTARTCCRWPSSWRRTTRATRSRRWPCWSTSRGSRRP